MLDIGTPCRSLFQRLLRFLPSRLWSIYVYAVTVEETEEPVVGQNTLGDTKIKVVKYEDVRGYIENAIEGANFLEK